MRSKFQKKANIDLAVFQNTVLLFIFLVLLNGCNTTEITPRLPIEKAEVTLPVSIAVGRFTDSRHRYNREELSKTQIQIGMNRIKNTAAQSLDDSNYFERIINIPTSFFGEELPLMVNTARKSKCQYLLVGEVDNFDIKILGHNSKAIYSALLEPFATPTNLIIYFSTGGKGGVFFQGLIDDRTVEVNLSATVALIDIRNGSIVGNFTLEERVIDTINYLFYGDKEDPNDDWRDVGKNIGERAMFNLFVHLIPKLAKKVEEDVQKKAKLKQKNTSSLVEQISQDSDEEKESEEK